LTRRGFLDTDLLKYIKWEGSKMVKICFLATLFLILISMTLGVENQVARLSIDEMKNIKGGAGDKQKCGPSVYWCGTQPDEFCKRQECVGGYYCTSFTGRKRYSVLGCEYGGTYQKCDYSGSQVYCLKSWICETDESVPLHLACVIISQTYTYWGQCRAYDE